MTISRRQLLGYGLALGTAAVAPNALAAIDLNVKKPLTCGDLCFYQTHTGENATITLDTAGMIAPDQQVILQHIMRDHRTGDQIDMDPELIRWLADVKAHFDTQEPFQIISAYRSPKTNAMLAGKSGGVAKKSYHMKGQAIDIRIPGVNTKEIRDYARSMKRGGVGYYAKSDFVHLDTGRVRQW